MLLTRQPAAKRLSRPKPSRQRTAPLQVTFVLPRDRQYMAVPAELDEQVHKDIAGIVPLIVKKVNKFLSSLRPREQAQFDETDLIQELWVVLMEKYPYFKDELGFRFATWADYPIRQHLAELRNRCHVVDSPRDTANRLKDDEKRDTPIVRSIRRAIADVVTIDEVHNVVTSGVEPPDEMVTNEHAAQLRADVMSFIWKLNPVKIKVLCFKYGLMRHREKSCAEIAVLLGDGMTSSGVSRIAHEAEDELRGMLQQTGTGVHL